MKSFFLGWILCVAAVVCAQSPETISYQGVLRSSAGTPVVNHAISVRFEIRQGSAGGTVAFTETIAVTTSPFGLFNARIGEQTSGGIAGVDWRSGPWFLAVAVDTANADNFVPMGAQELVSAPYALHAKYAHEVSSTFTNNVLTIAGTSYTLAPPVEYGGGNGIAVTGTLISNTAPDQTVTIQPQGNNVKIDKDPVAFTTVITFSAFEEQLPKGEFIRVHRSFIINKSKIRIIEGNRIFIEEYEIPIGANYRDPFLKAIGMK